MYLHVPITGVIINQYYYDYDIYKQKIEEIVHLICMPLTWDVT